MMAQVLAVAGTDVLESTVAGVALGCRYALIALAFVVVHRATGVINFATGGFVLLGGYLTYNYSQTWGLNFYLSILLAMLPGFVFGVLVEAVILRKLVDAAPFTVVMVTIGLLFVMNQVLAAIWGDAPLPLGDPWTGHTTQLGDVSVTHRNLWAMAFTAALLSGFLVLFRYSRIGLAMRATALDAEAAQAQGIRARSVYRMTWGIAGLVAALAGTIFSAGSNGLDPVVGSFALAAFPAMVLGGLDSPLGAVIGGIIIGIVQQLTALYATAGYLDFAGTSPGLVAPYVVMLLILMVRPYGLFGVKEVRRA